MNVVNLYFDINDDANWNEKDVHDRFANLSEVKMRDTEILTIINLLNDYNSKNNEKQINYYEEELQAILKDYLLSLDKLINSFGRNKTAIDSVIQKLKKQIKGRTGL
jgi:hypothetical protein